LADEHMTFSRGVSYSFPLKDSEQSKMRWTGFEDGKFVGGREIPVLLDGGPPRREAIDRFGKRLLEMYAGIRASSQR